MTNTSINCLSSCRQVIVVSQVQKGVGSCRFGEGLTLDSGAARDRATTGFFITAT